MVGALTDRRLASAAKAMSRRRDYLDGRALAEVFAWLRPGDLVQNYWVNNYLLGKKPSAFDVLFWNADTTRMRARLHADFVDLATMDNKLVTPGALTVLGTPIDLSQVDADTYIARGHRGPHHAMAELLPQHQAARPAWQAEIALTGLRVPEENRLPGVHSFKDAGRVLAGTRNAVAWGALGHATAAYEAARRTQFGKPLVSFQIVQDRLVKVLAEVTAMQLYCLRLGRLIEEGRSPRPRGARPGLAGLGRLAGGPRGGQETRSAGCGCAGSVRLSAVSKSICCSGRGRSPLHTRAADAVSGWCWRLTRTMP